MVRVYCKRTSLDQVPEVAYGPEDAQKFPIEGGPFLLIRVFRRQLSAEECQGFPTQWASLFQHGTEREL